MLDDPNPELRASLVGLIEKADHRPATERIRLLLHDSHVEVRKAALAAVTAWRDTEMLETVRTMAFSDANSFLRPQAVQSLVEIAGSAAAQADLAKLLTDTNAKVRAIAERLLNESAGQENRSEKSPSEAPPAAPQTLRWVGDETGYLKLLDQTRLPLECVEICCRDAEAVFHAIRQMRVRGAPAIGIAAAYGLYLGVQPLAEGDDARFFSRLEEVQARLASSRPTAVNLFWALDRMRKTAEELRGKAPVKEILRRLFDEARQIHEQDRAICRQIGQVGAALFRDGQGVLTHCNAGGLATSEYGTALAAIFAAHEQGKRLAVFVDETRPLLQGARLTAWELAQRGITATLICDSMAAQVMREGKVQAVIVGADRIAANGDVANKIGTYSLALVAAAHGVPLYVAAPTSTFDLSLASGDEIPIEERSAEEVTRPFGRQSAPLGVGVYNPAFDVTPARLIRGIVTERGMIEPVNEESIRRLMI
jgi:methylthioribose-1-phosphate isomerase